MAKETYDQWWRRRERWLTRLKELREISSASALLITSDEAKLKRADTLDKTKLKKNIAAAKRMKKKSEREIKSTIKKIEKINKEKPEEA